MSREGGRGGHWTQKNDGVPEAKDFLLGKVFLEIEMKFT